jgi:outer membrane protein
MKKTWVCLFTILIAVLMVLPAQAAPDKKAKDPVPVPVVKIGVIDLQRILRESKAAKSANDIYQKDLSEKRAVLAAKQKEIQAMEEELKDADSKLADDAKREKADKRNRDIRELKLLTTDMETDLKRKDAELAQKVLGEVVKVVNDYIKKENITLVLNRMAVVVLDETLDITNTIIKLYDAGK